MMTRVVCLLLLIVVGLFVAIAAAVFTFRSTNKNLNQALLAGGSAFAGWMLLGLAAAAFIMQPIT